MKTLYSLAAGTALLASGCSGPCRQDCTERSALFEQEVRRCEFALETQDWRRDTFGISYYVAASHLLGTRYVLTENHQIFELDSGHFRAQRAELIDLLEDALDSAPDLARQEISIIIPETRPPYALKETLTTPQEIARRLRGITPPRKYNPVTRWLRGTFGWLLYERP